MSKQTARRPKKAAKAARAARPAKKAHVRKATRVKKTVTQPEQGPRKAAAKQQRLEPEGEVPSVDVETFGQEPESVTGEIEIFEIEVVGDAEEAGENDESELTLEDND